MEERDGEEEERWFNFSLTDTLNWSLFTLFLDLLSLFSRDLFFCKLRISDHFLPPVSLAPNFPLFLSLFLV